MSNLQERLQESIRKGKVSEVSAFSGFQGRMRDMVRAEVERFKDEIVQELNRIMTEKVGEEGITKLKGDRGYTPIRGVDYLTPNEMQAIMQDLRPVKGRDYADGLPGIDGRNPSRRELEAVIARHLSKIPKDKFDINKVAAEIARALEKLQGEQRLDYEALKNRPGIPMYDRKKFGGKGGRGGGGMTEMTTSSAVNGTNADFIFATKPNFIVSDGIWYRENGGWTWSAPTATLAIPPIYSLFAFV